MRTDLYQAETANIAAEQTALLNEVSQRLKAGQPLSRLEQNGVLHAIQILIENAIGKAKQWLKAMNKPVPVSAYDAFDDLTRQDLIDPTMLERWNSVIGLRNRIVHEYMNIEWNVILEIVKNQEYQFITDFLLRISPDLGPNDR